VRYTSIICCLLIIVACKYEQGGKDRDEQISQGTTEVNSINDPFDPSYLVELPTREIAELILIDSIKPLDNQATFRVIDSLWNPSSSSRNYFLIVFTKIMSNSDGALSEVVGDYSKKYVEKYPNEFLRYSLTLDDETFQKWSTFVGWEIYLDSHETNSLENANVYFENIRRDCTGCGESELEKLEDMEKIALSAIKEQI